MYTINIFGSASKSTIKTLNITNQTSLNISLLELLQKEGIPVASSCFGNGVCNKCLINNNLMSCQITLEKFLEESPNHIICISYL
jgi:Na+-transporting NADH:ubiquinone oxidoreductase subunit NqrF